MSARTPLNLRRRLRGISRTRLWAVGGSLALTVLLLSTMRAYLLERNGTAHDPARDTAEAAATAPLHAQSGPTTDTPARPRGTHAAPSPEQARQRIWLQGALMALALLLLCALWEVSRRPRSGSRSDPPSGPPDDACAAPPPRAATGSPRESDVLVLAGSRMRQPLHALSLFAGSLNRDALPTQRRALQGLEASVREMAGVIDEVERISRLLRHEIAVAPTVLAVDDAFERLRPLVAHAARDRAIAVHWHAGGLRMHSDPALTCTLLHALVEHAIRHARRRVLVAARRAPGCVRLQVRDDGDAPGPGAAGSPLEALLRRTQETDDRDAGLELAVCAGIVELLGLRMRVRPLRKRGSTVTVDFPRASEAAMARPDDATALSLALLESEARQGRRPQSRLPGATANTDRYEHDTGTEAVPEGTRASQDSNGAHRS